MKLLLLGISWYFEAYTDDYKETCCTYTGRFVDILYRPSPNIQFGGRINKHWYRKRNTQQQDLLESESASCEHALPWRRAQRNHDVDIDGKTSVGLHDGIRHPHTGWEAWSVDRHLELPTLTQYNPWPPHMCNHEIFIVYKLWAHDFVHRPCPRSKNACHVSATVNCLTLSFNSVYLEHNFHNGALTVFFIIDPNRNQSKYSTKGISSQRTDRCIIMNDRRETFLPGSWVLAASWYVTCMLDLVKFFIRLLTASSPGGPWTWHQSCIPTSIQSYHEAACI